MIMIHIQLAHNIFVDDASKLISESNLLVLHATCRLFKGHLFSHVFE